MTTASATAPDGAATVTDGGATPLDDAVVRLASRMLGYLSLAGACAGIALILL